MSKLTKKQKRKLTQDGIVNRDGDFNQSRFKVQPFYPKTPAQETAFDYNERGFCLVLDGSAGTGKSFLSLVFALEDVMSKESPRNKVTIIRSAVPTRDMGFQPGTKNEKEAVYNTPYPPLVNQIFNRKDAYQILASRGNLEFTSTSYLRSVTLDNQFIVVDEAQNMTYHELSTIITRVGKNTRIIFAGDAAGQVDLNKRNDKSGFATFTSVLETMPQFKVVDFGPQDIVRSGLVKSFILAEHKIREYNQDEIHQLPIAA